MFDQLKPLMRSGERYIVVEGGRPEYVLLRFADYSALVGERGNPVPPGGAGRSPSPAADGRGEWERANAELEEVLTAEPAIRTADFGAPILPPDPATIRLEDLPL
ncbi:MAG: hypothetical protein Q8R35_03755 [bacterium]|nr:hypothetical protein [bacterium]